MKDMELDELKDFLENRTILFNYSDSYYLLEKESITFFEVEKEAYDYLQNSISSSTLKNTNQEILDELRTICKSFPENNILKKEKSKNLIISQKFNNWSIDLSNELSFFDIIKKLGKQLNVDSAVTFRDLSNKKNLYTII